MWNNFCWFEKISKNTRIFGSILKYLVQYSHLISVKFLHNGRLGITWNLLGFYLNFTWILLGIHLKFTWISLEITWNYLNFAWNLLEIYLELLELGNHLEFTWNFWNYLKLKKLLEVYLEFTWNWLRISLKNKYDFNQNRK